jgi:hypothetical protein
MAVSSICLSRSRKRPSGLSVIQVGMKPAHRITESAAPNRKTNDRPIGGWLGGARAVLEHLFGEDGHSLPLTNARAR